MNMRQAIVTKFVGPTNCRGSRIIAKADAGKITVEYDHALNGDQNHLIAAQKLAEKFGWKGALTGGGLPDGVGAHYCFVFTPAVDSLRTLTKSVVGNTEGNGNPFSRPSVKGALQTLASHDGAIDYLNVDLG